MGIGVKAGQVRLHLPSKVSTSNGCEGKANLVLSLRPAFPLDGLLAPGLLLPVPGKVSQLDQQVVAKGKQCALHIATSSLTSSSSLDLHLNHICLLLLVVLATFLSSLLSPIFLSSSASS